MNPTLQLLLLIVSISWTVNARVFEIKSREHSKSRLAEVEENCVLNFADCPDVSNPNGKIVKAVFNGTCSGQVALLKKGTHVAIEFSFTSNVVETSLTSHVSGKLGPLPFVNFPLDQPDACKDSGLTCPVAAHQTAKFSTVLDVKSIYPSVNVIVKWELKDQNDAFVFCGEVPASIHV